MQGKGTLGIRFNAVIFAILNSYTILMKRYLSRFIYAAAFFTFIPIIFTLLIQGIGDSPYDSAGFIPQEMSTESLFDEDILPGIVANEISMETELEAIKAQAVIARTNCLRAIEQGEELPEGLTKGEMIRLWGQENFTEYYGRLEEGISATKGVVMVYGGSCIRADFHTASAGYTRDAGELYGNADFPYLKCKDSRMDISSEDFLKVVFYSPRQIIEKGGDLFGEETKGAADAKAAADILSQLVVTKRDTAGYVIEITIDGVPHSGEEVRLKYGWNSSAFSFKEVDGEIRVVTKGLGHGLGLSLYGANQLAAGGYAYKDILKYFYDGIEFVTQYD